MKQNSFTLDDILGTRKGQGLRSDARPEESPDISGENSPDTETQTPEGELEGIDELMEDSNLVDKELSEEISDEGGSETNIPEDSQNEVNIDMGGKTAGEVVKEALDEKMKAYKVFISGRLLLVMCDAIFPRVIFGGAKWVGYKSDKKSWQDIKLTKEQIEELEPIADEIVDYIFDNVHPLAQFSMALGASYAENL